MKFIFFICSIFCLLSVACSKSNAGKPVITLQSVNTIIPVDGELDAVFKFTNSKGKLGSGTFTAIIVNLNQQPASVGDSLADTLTSPIPSFPDNLKGQFEYVLPANSFHNHASQNDTFQMKFAAIDAAGVSSDTIISPVIVALYQ